MFPARIIIWHFFIGLLKKSQPASAAVESSFSLLIILLAKDSMFKLENIARYLSVYYNA